MKPIKSVSNMSNISIIVAVARNGAIGKDQSLLCPLPNDLKRFKALTTGHTVIMGRNTFLSLPKGALPDRRNIVLTSRAEARYPGTEVFSSLEAALASVSADESVFIIGGASVYRAALPIVDRLYLTEIDHDFPDADTFLPEIDFSVWRECNRDTRPADERHPYAYAFVDYVRK